MNESELNAGTPEKASSLHEADSCCPAWIGAQQRGTDNEMYGPALWRCGEEWRFGCNTPEVRFCPWCGSQKAAANVRVSDSPGPQPTQTMPDKFKWSPPPRKASSLHPLVGRFYTCGRHGWDALEKPCPECRNGDAPRHCVKHGWSHSTKGCPECGER